MSDLLEYKGYYGTVEYSEKDDCLFGKIVGINGLFLYEGKTVEELKTDFMEMVDSYLETCKDNKINPEKAYKGSFNVRMSPELHKEAAIYSIKNGITLNSLVEHSLRTFLNSQANTYNGMYASETSFEYKPKKKKSFQN